MKIYLADLAHTHSTRDASLTVPLNIGYIKAHAHHRFGQDVSIQLFKHPERMLSMVSEEPPDMVGFSNYGWNVRLNKRVGAYLRARWPQAMFVAGGPNIDADETRRLGFLQEHEYLDFLIVDSGEKPFSDLVHWAIGGSRDRTTLGSNLVWREADRLFTTETRPLEKEIADVPSPYLDGHLDAFLEAGMVPLLETNRGCPFPCTFCAWGSAAKSKVQRFSLDRALDEISYVGRMSSAPNWIVCDANFGILERDVQIAEAIRETKDQRGRPATCYTWLAKNVTDRNLEIGRILGDMTVPVMAVQSMDPTVLNNIKRGNISLDTYAAYQQKFHDIGSSTYSDVIVPLPGETLETHLNGLQTLFEMDVDIVQPHNMRLLAGAEINNPDTRQAFGFKTRYRLIHGDAGVYSSPDGDSLTCFEYEESLRETTTLSETEMFYLRKLHFLVDFCWNMDVYKPLLKVAKHYGTNPLDILVGVLEIGKASHLSPFWEEFEEHSRNEWFDDARDIENYFDGNENFQRLIGNEFEKLNLQFSALALNNYKGDFDRDFEEMMGTLQELPGEVISEASRLNSLVFPTPDSIPQESPIVSRLDVHRIIRETTADFELDDEPVTLVMLEPERREQLRQIIRENKGETLSKILNAQGFRFNDLRMHLDVVRSAAVRDESSGVAVC